jgi:hypothetical protein
MDIDWKAVFSLFGYLIAWLFYYCTYFLLVVVLMFLQIGHAIALSLALAWGGIAIPMSIPVGFGLLRPWARLLAILLVWPLIHFAIFWFLGGIFDEAFKLLSNGSTAPVEPSEYIALYTVYAIGHFLLTAGVLAAPFVTQSLLSSGSVGGLIGTFATGGVAAASTLWSKQLAVGKAGAGQFAQRGVNALSGLASRAIPGLAGGGYPRGGGDGGARGGSRSPGGKGRSNDQSTGGSTPKTAGMSAAAMALQGSADKGTESPPGERAARQARRGAVLNRLHKTGKIDLKGRKKKQ